MQEWLADLPVANLGNTTRALYDAIDEFARLQTTAQLRFELIEHTRAVIYFALEGLEKHYLNQPILLPSQPRKVANLAHALRYRLMTVYIAVALQCKEKMHGFRLNKPTQLMAQAIHRAISEASQILIQCCQLYRPLPAGFWADIHQLYLLAENHKLLDIQVSDPQVHLPSELAQSETYKSNISMLYRRALLLGCVKANQLRQDDIRIIDRALRNWANLVDLTVIAEKNDKVFIVDPDQDNPPIYRKFYKGQLGKDCHCLDTTVLISHLRAQADPDLQNEDSGVSTNLLNHLIVAWGVLSDRTFMRLEAQDRLALCIGLSTAHFYLSNGISFNEMVGRLGSGDSLKLVQDEGKVVSSQFQEKQSQQQIGDVWSEIYKPIEDDISTISEPNASISLESIDYHVNAANKKQAGADRNGSKDSSAGSSGGNNSSDAEEQDKYQNFQVQMVNMSPGGYCLEWPQDAPNQLKTGEIIGIKETHHANWSVGAIRWVRQDSDGGVKIGVELLSPTALPCAARVVQKAGERSDYMRVLLLPEIKPIGLPMTLLTPMISFKEGQKIQLLHEGIQTTVQLDHEKANSGSYHQFEFSELTQIGDNGQHNTQGFHNEAEDGFDSVWKSL